MEKSGWFDKIAIRCGIFSPLSRWGRGEKADGFSTQMKVENRKVKALPFIPVLVFYGLEIETVYSCSLSKWNCSDEIMTREY